MKELTVELVDVMERLIESVDRLVESGEERIAKITATVDNEREADLLRRLEEAEAKIAEASGRIAEANGKLAELSANAAAAVANAGRKTAAVGSMLAKHGEGVEASALDAALASLSVEQRLAVKAELLRSGAIT